MLTRLWAENKRFLLVVGGGLVAFVLLNALVGLYLKGSRGLVKEATGLERESRSLLRDLKPFHDHKRRLEYLEKHEAALRAELELPPEKELEKLDEQAPLVQLNQAVDRTWGQALERANRASVAIPEKLGPQDFGVERGDTRADYERHYTYLGIIRRALSVLIDAGIAEIGRPELVQEELLPVILGDETGHCLFRGARLKVTGTYESILRVLKGVQAPQSFLQVNIVHLGAKSPGEERLLKGELEFVGFRLVEGAQAREDAKPTPKQPSRPKRPRR